MDFRALKARDWKATCEVCGKTFSYKDGFDCLSQPGRHSVEPKDYYHLGAGHIQSIRDRRMFAPTLNLRSDMEVRDKVTGQITRLEGVLVHFRESGQYSTSDPQEQYYLDMHPAVVSGREGREAWEKVYFTQQQQLDKANQQLAAVQKEIRENNALLNLQKKGKEDAAQVR